MPTVVQVKQSDVDDLATKLDEFSAVLNDREKAVLLGVLGMAQQPIAHLAEHHATKGHSASGGESTGGSLPPLSAGFRSAFSKGVGSKFKIDTGGEAEAISIKISGDWSR